ncbi:MAG: SIS domain-containing protein [Chloroflexota bacterium]|nr:MAG: SIS domain-containing protein [Chloroflexota bacterium]
MTSTILEQEIREQPLVIERLLETENDHVAQICEDLRGRFNYILIAARGTSDNAARYAQYLLGSFNKLPVALATPSLFTTYGTPPDLQGALVMGISQSGRSPDIISVVEEGRRQGRPALVITNDPNSPLADAANHVIDLVAGPERAVAATKTYTSSLAALALVSAHLAKNSEIHAQILRLPGFIRQVIDTTFPALQRVERYRYMGHCVVIGRGFNYATAFEISLKIKELTQTIAEPYSSADFLHGPIAMIKKGFPVLVIAPSGSVLDDMRELYERLLDLKAELLLISDQDALLDKANLPLRLPAGMPEWLSPVVAVVPGQLFSFALASSRGLSPDKPEGIHKVTETW